LKNFSASNNFLIIPHVMVVKKPRKGLEYRFYFIPERGFLTGIIKLKMCMASFFYLLLLNRVSKSNTIAIPITKVPKTNSFL